MTRFLLSMVLGVSAALGLLLPLPLSEAAIIAKNPRADTRDRPPGRWGHLSGVADATGVAVR